MYLLILLQGQIKALTEAEFLWNFDTRSEGPGLKNPIVTRLYYNYKHAYI